MLWKRLSILFLALIASLIVATEFLLPQVAQNAVAQGMAEITGTGEVQATVSNRPAIGMLAGSFDHIKVESTNAKIDKIVFSSLKADFRKIQLDRQQLYLNRSVKIEQIGEVNVEAVLTQDEVARYLNQNVKGVKNTTVTLDKGKMQAQSSFVLGGIASVSIGLEGRVLNDGQRIKFVTDKLLLNNSPVGNVGGIGLAEISLLDLKKLPFGVTVRDIILEQGKLTLYADNKSR